RMEGELLWHPARPGKGCGGVLHGVEDCGRTLVEAGDAEVLAWLSGSRHVEHIHDHEAFAVGRQRADRVCADAGVAILYGSVDSRNREGEDFSHDVAAGWYARSALRRSWRGEENHC